MTDMPEWRRWADRAHQDSLARTPKSKRRYRCSNPKCGHRTSEGLAKKNGGKCFSCKHPLRAWVKHEQ